MAKISIQPAAVPNFSHPIADRSCSWQNCDNDAGSVVQDGRGDEGVTPIGPGIEDARLQESPGALRRGRQSADDPAFNFPNRII